MRWNTDKRYLLDLQQSGISVVPTMVVGQTDQPSDVAAAIARHGWDDVVVKPSVGASSHGAKRIGASDRDAAVTYAMSLARAGAALVQPFQRGVLVERERSLVMVGGELTHAFTKAAFNCGAAAGEVAAPAHEPTAAEQELAVGALATLPVRPNYARVDVVPGASGPLLMELELIEPHLALGNAPAAAKALANLILTSDPSKRSS